MIKDKTVMNKPPISVTAHQGDGFKEAAAFDGVNDFLRQDGLLRRAEARRIHYGADKPLHDFKQRHHKLQAIGDNAFGKREADK